MKGVALPPGFRVERLNRARPRGSFTSGQPEVDAWLKTRALQNQDKNLSVTRVLLGPDGILAGYYTLATGQVDFGELPPEMTRKLPRRMLPVAILAWLGVDAGRQGQGLGRLLLALALRDCHEAGQTFAFVAVILDCIDDSARRFYRTFDFAPLPGHPYRLFLASAQLEAMMAGG